jgi:hypothetical protein
MAFVVPSEIGLKSSDIYLDMRPILSYIQLSNFALQVEIGHAIGLAKR